MKLFGFDFPSSYSKTRTFRAFLFRFSKFRREAHWFKDYYIYQHAFEFSHLGYAATAAWVLFLMVLLGSALFWRVARRRVHY